MSSLPDRCQVCGLDWPILESAHIRPERHFYSQSISDTDYNLIKMCPNHHKMMDRKNLLIICPTKKHYILEIPGQGIETGELVIPALIKDEYLDTRYEMTNISGINSRSDVLEICGCPK